MSTMSTGKPAQQQLLEITRTLTQQPNLHALARSLGQIARQNGLADRVNLQLYHPRHQRVCFYGQAEDGTDIHYEDELALSHGPVRELLSQPQVLVYDWPAFSSRWPRLLPLKLYTPFSAWAMLPLSGGDRVLGGCEFIRRQGGVWDQPALDWMHTLTHLAALAVELVQQQVSCREKLRVTAHQLDDAQILVKVTNAVLAKLEWNDLLAEIFSTVHRYFDIDAISIILTGEEGRASLHSAHYMNGEVPVCDGGDIAMPDLLLEKVRNSGEMLLINPHSGVSLTPGERQLLQLWDNKIQSICLLPLHYADKFLGVLSLAQCANTSLTTANLKLLGQIAERVAIAVDNALTWKEVNRLKERLVHENLSLTERINNVEGEFGEIIGRSDAMTHLLQQVELVAKCDATVLILGETGTGKELIARAIHRLSNRNANRMVKMNCAAVPAGLLESDLFGHERGAFTGASAQHIGRFELADNSSLFLDEVGDMPLDLQPKLLRVLQEQEFERVGSNKVKRVDVRLIAATNRDLKHMVDLHEFRSDLYYRLNVFPILLPPLRERPEDIPLLVKYFTFKIACRLQRSIDSIPVETLRLLSQQEWPGNVRELENVIERAVILTRGNVLSLSSLDLIGGLPARQPAVPGTLPPGQAVEPGTPHGAFSDPGHAGHDEGEYQQIVMALKACNGVVAGPRGAAMRLGVKRTTLLSRIKRLGIVIEDVV